MPSPEVTNSSDYVTSLSMKMKRHSTVLSTERNTCCDRGCCCAEMVHGIFLNRRITVFPRIFKGGFDLISRGQYLTDILKMSLKHSYN